MTIAVFTTIWTTDSTSGRLGSNFRGAPLNYLRSTPEVMSVDLFVPETGEAPKFEDEAAPAMIIQTDVRDAAEADALTRQDDFKRLLAAESAYDAAVERVSVDCLETVHFPVPGHRTPPPRTAQTSFVVRYYGPNGDVADFVRFYTAHHPLLLAKFPGIRNVLCYLPLGWESTGAVEDSRVILGNEVVFDDLDALNRALASDILPQLRAEGRQFGKFGRSTHHAMRRERLYARDKP